MLKLLNGSNHSRVRSLPLSDEIARLKRIHQNKASALILNFEGTEGINSVKKTPAAVLLKLKNL